MVNVLINMKQDSKILKGDEPEAQINRLLNPELIDSNEINDPSSEQKEKFSLLFYNNNFLEKIKKIRTTFNIPSNGFTERSEAIKWIKKIQISRYEKSINDLLLTANASERWKNSINCLLLFNNQKPYHLFPDPFIFYVNQDKKGSLHLIMEIFIDTSLEDIKKKWPNIEKHKKTLDSPNEKSEKQKNKNEYYLLNRKEKRIEKKTLSLLPRDRHIKSLSKYVKIYNQKRAGKTYKEISEMEEIKALYKGAVTYNDIEKDLNRFNFYIKKNRLF